MILEKSSKFSGIIALSLSEIGMVDGGEKVCDCRGIDENKTVTSVWDSKETCKEWCCNLKHKYFKNKHGKFYIWDLGSELEWKKC